jgi:hypothetical protein
MSSETDRYGRNRGVGAGAGASGGIYGLAFIGAAVYFIGQASTFWLGVLGFLKALVWPAFLVWGLLKHVGL